MHFNPEHRITFSNSSLKLEPYESKGNFTANNISITVQKLSQLFPFIILQKNQMYIKGKTHEFLTDI